MFPFHHALWDRSEASVPLLNAPQLGNSLCPCSLYPNPAGGAWISGSECELSTVDQSLWMVFLYMEIFSSLVEKLSLFSATASENWTVS